MLLPPALAEPFAPANVIRQTGRVTPERMQEDRPIRCRFRPQCYGLAAAVGFALMPAAASAQVCHPSVSAPTIVVTPEQRRKASRIALPPTKSGFDWPDTPLGVIKTATGYEFFGSDGGYHPKELYQGQETGNGKAGSIVTTFGTLDNPLGTAPPLDVSVSENPDESVDPFYSTYGYIGGGPVFQVPAGMRGAGRLLATYHAELPGPLYAALGLAASSDNGLHWIDLGEIIRFNQAWVPGHKGFEIGDGPLVLSPDGQFFYLYFPDWIADGTKDPTTTTSVSVARARVSAVLDAAFGAQPHAVSFEKFYLGRWHLQPGIGGASSDLIPGSAYSGYLDVHYNAAIERYVLITSNDTSFGYAESVDGLTWTTPILLGTYGPIAAYPTAVGLGDDPHVLGAKYYIYFTHLPADGAGWRNGKLKRLTVTCR